MSSGQIQQTLGDNYTKCSVETVKTSSTVFVSPAILNSVLHKPDYLQMAEIWPFDHILSSFSSFDFEILKLLMSDIYRFLCCFTDLT